MCSEEGSVDGVSFLVNCSVRAEHLNYVLVPQDLGFIYSNVSLVKSQIAASNDLTPIFGVLFALMVYAIINTQVIKKDSPPLSYDVVFNLPTTLQRFFKSKTLSRAIVLVLLLSFTPIIIALILLALLYKLLCSFIIRRNDRNFQAFLDGFDVFWSLRDGDSRNIIHVLGVIEADSSEILVHRIKEKLKIVLSNDTCSKIFYKRCEKYGWYYWEKNENIDLNEYVKVLNVGNAQNICKKDLECAMTDICNRSLPYNGAGLFQILVTKQKIGNCQSEAATSDYGILFRIDHAVGDGVALIEFLCHALADKGGNGPSNLFSVPGSYNAEKHKPVMSILDMLEQLYSLPICFIDGILRKPDENSLHGPTLLGRKIFQWTDPEEDLFQMIKDIKLHNREMNFSDVLATSLAGGLRNYFAKTMDHIPEDVAVILPIRLPKLDNEFKLENNFTVTILDLPTKEKRPIKEIRRRCKLLRKSADPMVNHYFLKICYLLPKQILRPIFMSTQATLVFSNMPGPDSILSICGGSAIKSLVFFIPNKGITGLGVSALYYGGVLRFSAMADASLVPTSEHLSLILDSMVEEIRQLHAIYV